MVTKSLDLREDFHSTNMTNIKPPSRRILELADEYLRVFGMDLSCELAARIWPVWDHTLGLLLFVDDEPIFMSSCVKRVFRASDRCDVRRVPPLHTTDWNHYSINERTPPNVACSGNIAVVFLGEREHEPLSLLPMQPDSLAALPVGIEGIDVLVAGADAMIPSTYQACFIRHDGHVVKQYLTVPNGLGHDDSDTSWIPEEWFEPLQPGPPEAGCSTVRPNPEHGGPAEPVGLRWVRLVIDEFNLYWVRKLDRAEEAKARPHIHPLFPDPNL